MRSIESLIWIKPGRGAKGEQDGLLHDFLIETKEGVDHLDTELLALESNPEDRDLINAIFRRLHTIKGGLDFHSSLKREKRSWGSSEARHLR